jgi:hypothetical protein
VTLNLNYTPVQTMDEPVPYEKPVRDDIYYLESVIFLVSGSVVIIFQGNMSSD